MGEGLELWMNRCEASLVLKALVDRARQESDEDDTTLYIELEHRLRDLITYFDAEQARIEKSYFEERETEEPREE